MGIIASNSYLTVFGFGTALGACSAYFILRVRYNRTNVWKDGTEERFEVSIDLYV